MERLFAYGTLQLEQVQLDTFGRLLEGEKDTLRGYVVNEIRVTDPFVVASSGKEMHPILEHTGNANDIVEGLLFDITVEELSLADTYEVKAYKRVKLEFESGKDGYVYLKNE